MPRPTQVEENYQAQMGIAAQQQRTDKYMRSHTRSKAALLDPTSRLPVYPSDAVLVRPTSFGMGGSGLGSGADVVAAVAAKHSKRCAKDGAVLDLSSSLLLPRKYRCGHTGRLQHHSRVTGLGGACPRAWCMRVPTCADAGPAAPALQAGCQAVMQHAAQAMARTATAAAAAMAAGQRRQTVKAQTAHACRTWMVPRGSTAATAPRTTNTLPRSSRTARTAAGTGSSCNHAS